LAPFTLMVIDFSLPQLPALCALNKEKQPRLIETQSIHLDRIERSEAKNLD
jgi:hypothetical protein